MPRGEEYEIAPGEAPFAFVEQAIEEPQPQRLEWLPFGSQCQRLECPLGVAKPMEEQGPVRGRALGENAPPYREVEDLAGLLEHALVVETEPPREAPGIGSVHQADEQGGVRVALVGEGIRRRARRPVG